MVLTIVTREQSQTRIEQENFLTWLEIFRLDMLVVPVFNPFFVHSSVVVSVSSPFIELIQLEHTLFPSLLKIKIQESGGPIRSMFKLNWKVTSLPEHHPIW